LRRCGGSSTGRTLATSTEKLTLRDRLPETERLIVRRFEEGDFDALLSIQSRPDLARWLYWEARSPTEVRRSLEQKRTGELAADGDWVSVAVVRKDSGELIGDGSICLRSREHRQGEIGFIIHPDHQGCGFATEAARALLELCFDDLDLHRVIGRLEARNTASAGVLERIGMRREGHLVENEFVKDEWQSELVYAILQREWRAAQAGPGVRQSTDERA
jgi:RimJ/RimL family protein N-acetyltransferase